MKLLFLIFFFTVAIIAPGYSQQDSPQKDTPRGLPVASAVPKELYSHSASFFKLLLTSDIEEAYDGLLKQSPIHEKQEQYKRLIDQTKRAFQLYGNAQGYERVDDEYISESLMRIRYITIHDELPMRWVFTYYRSPKRGWIIINIKFDDEAEYFFKDE
ncbi:MAG: hypothetical protein V4642_14275 [Bacteroidota bacterium]